MITTSRQGLFLCNHQWSSDITFLRWQLGLVCQESDATWTRCPERKAFWDTVKWLHEVKCQYLHKCSYFDMFSKWFWGVHWLFISRALWNALLLISLSTIYALAVKKPFKEKWNCDLETVKMAWKLGGRSKESQKHKKRFLRGVLDSTVKTRKEEWI